MKSIQCIWALALWPSLLPAFGQVTPSAEDSRYFDETVRPVLEQRCLECHSHASGKMKNGLTLDSRAGWIAGGDSGPAVVPGDLDKSLLIKAIRYSDPDLRMPPKRKLPDAEIAILEEWVKRGAPDPRATVVEKKGAAAADWWSLRPLTRPPVPHGPAHPVDAFVSQKLDAHSLIPAPEADRRTLIRRLYLDLHGLLPPPEEVAAFVQDCDPHAYERLLDRLLASPRYGERWARHWLDTIHFADTHGFEHDLIRTNAWPYRDYVIESLNRETPWPRFIREQLAADVLYPDEPRLTAALGFIAAGPWDQSTAQTAPKNFEYLDRDDIVTQTMATFISTTVSCARCHDHKFDPIPQEDYYAVQAVFAGVGRGDLFYDEEPARARTRARWAGLRAAADQQEAAVLFASEHELPIAAWEQAHLSEATWTTLDPGLFLTTSASTLRRLPDGSLLAEGPRPETDTYTIELPPLAQEITALRLDVLADSSFPKNGPGRQDNGNFHLSEFTVQLFAPGATRPEKVALRRASADFEQSGWTIAHAIDGNDKTAWGVHPRAGESRTAVFELAQPLWPTNGMRVVVQLKQSHGQAHLLGRFRLSGTSDEPARARVLPFTVAEALAVPREHRSESQRLALAAQALRSLAEEALASLPPSKRVFGAGPVFEAVAEGGFYKPWPEPKPVHVLKRGDINHPGAAAVPGALSAITALPARFDQLPPKDEGARRRALAEWLAAPENPLTWRSIVNRVWHYHFGRGLTDTLNDFGLMGSEPSHPELLDWLACEFRDGGGSLKQLHRLMVTSAAYRRSAQVAEPNAARDPENRLLWRRSSRRLDAEAFRDAVLALAGRLDLTMGGPGIQHFKLGKPIQITPTVDYAPFDWNSAGAGRRSIYRFVYRGLPDPFMDALDFPDAAQLAPNRLFSASALQALALLNNDFVLHHSTVFAERLEHAHRTQEDQIRAAFFLAFQREPAEDEQAGFSQYAAAHGLGAMCRVLLNSNEFLFVD